MVSFYDDILPRLRIEQYFSTFKFIKKDISFLHKTEFGFHRIEFQLHTNSYDLYRQAEALKIIPIYGVRFDVLLKWFEKFSFKTLSDQHNNFNIGSDGSMLDKENEFYFLHTKKEFEIDYESLKERIIEISSNYFLKYKSVNDYYKIEVLPVFNKEFKLNDVGVDWIFEYLTAVKLCDFQRYDEMLEILKKQIHFMNSRKEPNIASYNNKFDLIFEHLRTTTLI